MPETLPALGVKSGLQGMGTFAHNPRMFETPEELMAKFLEYYTWNEENPLIEHKPFVSKGDAIMARVPKMRALSWSRFAVFLGTDSFCLYRMRKNMENLKEAFDYIADVMYAQKFEGAAAGLLNAHVISRDLGLAETIRLEDTNSPSKIDPNTVADKMHPDCTDEQLACIYAAGLEPPRYSQAQIDAGFPFIMPSLTYG
ncbi:hypothetical protein GCM10011360_02670 [Primorskyibacter flagellatus]|uniref:Uncharacterized protein n=1 Tax=Primorskyibacter flagellatus TaxID=1387277 RepID=A0A916ZWW4_9RHOB|nr:terminase small subunit [Primorskyibacter flagellatus]GGE17324.1 hypothetical protein GCM10011360_02670 [Primorskyibacter flagellatus]